MAGYIYSNPSDAPWTTKSKAKKAKKSLEEAKGSKGTKAAQKLTGKPKGTKTVTTSRQLGSKVTDLFKEEYAGGYGQPYITEKKKVPAYTKKQQATIKATKRQMVLERERTATRAAAKAKKKKK